MGITPTSYRGKLRQLTCALCGNDAGRHHQWWNRDIGFGICGQCATEELNHPTTPLSSEEFEENYGMQGIHWDY